MHRFSRFLASALVLATPTVVLSQADAAARPGRDPKQPDTIPPVVEHPATREA